MLTKGIITSINFNTNRCQVRIPLFETAGTKDAFVADAILATPPGVYNGYQINDVVVVGFGSGGAGDAVVIGKLYLGSNAEKNLSGGSLHSSDLVVTNTATLPINTNIVSNLSTNSINADTLQVAKYKTLQDLIIGVATNAAKINDLSENLPHYTARDTIIGSWLQQEELHQMIVTASQATTLLTNIDAVAIWLDVSNSFIQNSTTLTYRAIQNYTISLNQQNHTATIQIPELQGQSNVGAAAEQAILTVRYIKK